jgi:hypothetical protein
MPPLWPRRPGVVASLSLALALCWSMVARADEVGSVRFSVPAGWAARDHNGSRVILPSSLGKDELMLGIVLGVQPIAGTPTAKIDEVANLVDADVQVHSSSAVASGQRGPAGTLYLRSFEVSSEEIGKHARVIAILVRGKQCAVTLFLVSNTTTLDKYAAGFQAVLASLEIAGDTSTPASAAPATTGVPTGDTPDNYPGSSGFRPSGRGVRVPAARVVKGRPEGMWWAPQARNGGLSALRVIYLADGTCATAPRPGGPRLFDLEGQRRLGGVGTCSVRRGVFSRTIDGHTQGGAFRAGSDREGAYFDIGELRHRPLAPVEARSLIGTWRSPPGTATRSSPTGRTRRATSTTHGPSAGVGRGSPTATPCTFARRGRRAGSRRSARRPGTPS